MSLFWRVFGMNSALLVVAALALVVSPLTVSVPIAIVEAGVLAVGLALLLAANYVLLRRAFVPLESLTVSMRNVDLLRPGRRLPEGGDAEIAELVRTFNEMLDRLETERLESGSRAQAAQEEERKRVAMELHDEVGQTMTGVLLLLDRLSDELPPHRRDALLEAREAVRRSLDEVRRIARELRPEMLEHLGLASALKALGSSFAERTGLELEWRFANDLPGLSPDAELVVYRVAQESLTNVARHADARNVLLCLEPGRGSVVLRVIDDGHGMNGQVTGAGGIRGMRERSLVIGAALAVKEGPTGGVEVRLEVPAARM